MRRRAKFVEEQVEADGHDRAQHDSVAGEPCPMCLGAIYWSRVGRVYFAANRQDAANAGFDDSLIYDELGVTHAERIIPARNLIRDEALEVFRLWAASPGKVPY